MTGSFADAPAVIEYERHHTGSDEGRQGKNEGEGEGEGKKSMSATAAGGMEKATVYSTGRGVMQVISKFEYITHVKGHRSEWSLFLIGALLLTCLPYVRYRQLKGQLVKMNFAFTISGPTNGSGHTKGDKKK